MEKRLKSCTGILLRADLTWHSHPTLFGRIWLIGWIGFCFFPIRTFLAFIRGIIWVEILVITLVFSPKQPCLMYYFAHDCRAWIFLCCENCRNISWKCRCMKIRILLRTWFQPSALGKREQRILNLISLENAPHTTLALFLLDNLVCLSFVHYKRKCQWATRLFVFVRTKPMYLPKKNTGPLHEMMVFTL